MGVSVFLVAYVMAGQVAEPAIVPVPSPATIEAPAATPAAPETASPEAAAAPPPQKPADTEILVTGHAKAPAEDPLQSLNIVSYEAIQAVDQALIGPVALGYKHGLPKPVRSGLRNFLNNLNEPIVFVNFLLQLKPGKAMETVGRFAINTTLGGAGLFDVARRKPFELPRRSNGLADTLGFYGVKPGPYLFLPLIGSTTVRDMFGRSIDLLLLPTVVGKPFNRPIYAISSGAVSALDERAEMDDELRKIREAGNPYAAMREYYLKRREAEIDVLRGKRSSIDNPPAPVP